MTANFEQTMGQPYPLGISRVKEGINIALPVSCKRECGIVITPPHKNSVKIPFNQAYKVGNLYTILLKDFLLEEFTYQLYADDKMIADPYARRVNGRRRWGVYHAAKRQLSYSYQSHTFDWEGDTFPAIPFHESIFYGLHVRGFTKHTSSKVKAKGTFAGVVEKLPYLKQLGITAIVCMPFYDFDEIIVNREYKEIQENIKPFLDKEKQTWEYKINYWGFGDAQYFAPKASFSYSDDAVTECKRMIRELHRNGIECIMRIYFGDRTPHSFIYEVLKYWVTEFHVDGFQLMGISLPMEFLGNDALLGRTKLMAEYIPSDRIYRDFGNVNSFKNLAVMNDEFLIQARRFLKGDEDMLYTIAMQFRR
ncbi:MAG: hypothetical protein IJ711_11340, partial [Lachnospiraceae bacterium]|nr:hypothetical protein [Lachnospiraceae bacterium]